MSFEQGLTCCIAILSNLWLTHFSFFFFFLRRFRWISSADFVFCSIPFMSRMPLPRPNSYTSTWDLKVVFRYSEGQASLPPMTLIRYIILLEAIVLRAVSGHLIIISPESYSKEALDKSPLAEHGTVAISTVNYAQMHSWPFNRNCLPDRHWKHNQLQRKRDTWWRFMPTEPDWRPWANQRILNGR